MTIPGEAWLLQTLEVSERTWGFLSLAAKAGPLNSSGNTSKFQETWKRGEGDHALNIYKAPDTMRVILRVSSPGTATTIPGAESTMAPFYSEGNNNWSSERLGSLFEDTQRQAAESKLQPRTA